MAFSEYWRLADSFTLSQAAALWCDREPPHYLRENEMPDGFHAIKQALTGAVQTGVLNPANRAKDLFGNPRWEALHSVNSTTTLSRADLAAWAEARKQFPAFLFDTLLPVITGESNVTLGAVTSLATGTVVNAPQSQTPTDTVQPTNTVTPQKNAGGRPQKWDWDAMIREIIWIANIDGLPETKTQLVARLLAWFSETDNEGGPHQSQVYQRVSPIYDAFEAQGRKPKG